MRTVSVGDIAERIDYGVTAPARADPVGPKMLRITDIQDGAVDWSAVPHCVSTTKGVQTRQLGVGDIVFARTGTTGKSFLIQECPNGAVFASYLIRLRIRPEFACARYVSHFFRSPGYWHQITSLSDGGVQKGVNATKLKGLLLPLPPLKVQQRIAAVLDAADALRAKRRQALTKLDSLTRAVFIDMFGDPSSSSLFLRAPIGSAAEVVTGNTPLRSIAENYGDHIEWLKSGNISESGEITCAVECLSEPGRAKGREAPAGSTLVVCIAGSPRSIGRAGYLDRPAAFNQQINAVLPGPSVLPEFLFHQLRVGQRLVQRASTNSMKGMVSKSALTAVEILIPPIGDQRVFVESVEGIGQVRLACSESLVATDALLASLQQRAFRGEL